MYDSWNMFCENEKINMKHNQSLPFVTKIEITNYELPEWYNNDNYNEFEDESIYPIPDKELNESELAIDTEYDSESDYSSCDEYIDYY